MLVVAAIVALIILLLAIAFFALVLRVARGLAHRNPVFEIAFREGQLRSFAGPIPGRIRRELVEVAEFGDASGTVSYFAPGEYAFSEEVSAGNEQRFRNVLQLTFSLPPTPS